MAFEVLIKLDDKKYLPPENPYFEINKGFKVQAFSLLAKTKQARFAIHKPVASIEPEDVYKTVSKALSHITRKDFTKFRKSIDGHHTSLQYTDDVTGFTFYLFTLVHESGLYHLLYYLHKVHTPNATIEETVRAHTTYAIKMFDQQKELAALIYPAGRELYNTLPSTAMVDLCVDSFNYGADIKEIPDRKSLYSKANITCQETSEGFTITSNNGSTVASVTIPDISRLGRNNKDFQKLFLLFMVKVKEQAVADDGNLRKTYIEIPLQEFVDKGFYSSVESARKCVRKVCPRMGIFSISGKTGLRGRKTVLEEGGNSPFIGWRIRNSILFIGLNSNMSWHILTYFYTLIPAYYPKLSSRALTLLYKIAFLYRQSTNTNKIKRNGFFTISYRAIQYYLNLPQETKTTNPRRDIRKRITETIQEIEDMERNTNKPPEFFLERLDDDRLGISEYLDTGKLKISVCGQLKSELMRLSTSREKKQQDAAEKQDKKIL
jgi:hypothetical protein